LCKFFLLLRWSWLASSWDSILIAPVFLAVSRLFACRNLTVSGSVIGNLAMTQEMLDFCGQHGITADVEVRGVLTQMQQLLWGFCHCKLQQRGDAGLLQMWR
jgi:hypothetical protein